MILLDLIPRHLDMKSHGCVNDLAERYVHYAKQKSMVDTEPVHFSDVFYFFGLCEILGLDSFLEGRVGENFFTASLSFDVHSSHTISAYHIKHIVLQG